jgi:hypothetical protein
MKDIKTPKELFEIWRTTATPVPAIDFIMAEHDKEILELIDEMREYARYNTEADWYIGYVKALTELKERLK